jgi:hypothetical protein
MGFLLLGQVPDCLKQVHFKSVIESDGFAMLLQEIQSIVQDDDNLQAV